MTPEQKIANRARRAARTKEELAAAARQTAYQALPSAARTRRRAMGRLAAMDVSAWPALGSTEYTHGGGVR